MLAREAAVKSVVLLKNKNNLLPITDKVKSVLVVGPNAGSVNVLLGNYYGMNSPMTTFLEGVVGRAPEGMRVEFMPGSLLANKKRVENDWSLYASPGMDVTIAFMGLSPLLEGEEGEAILSDNGDRTEIRLPEVQLDYLRKLATSGGKVVLVLSGGSPVALDGVEDLVDAILYVWYPGQDGGAAVADVLFGDANPAGRLPLTFPKSLDQLPPFDDYAMAERTYRYAAAEPLFPFGFGLSYTQFTYGPLVLEERPHHLRPAAARPGDLDQHRQHSRRRSRAGLSQRPAGVRACPPPPPGRFPPRLAGSRRDPPAGYSS